MKEQNLNNYHWTEGDITQYSTDYLQKKFIENGYIVKNMKLEAFINQRMGKIGFTYFMCADIYKNDKKIEFVDFDQFSGFDEFENEDRKVFEQIFEDYKKDAIKNCSKYVLEGKESNTTHNKSETIYYDVNRGVKTDEILKTHEILFIINCKKDDMVNFLTKKQFIEMWTNNNVEVENNNMTIMTQFIFNDIKFEDYCMTCKWKHSSWDDFKDLCIRFNDRTEGCGVHLVYKNIEKEKSNNLMLIWEKTIFSYICYRFNYKIVTVKQKSK